MKIQDNKIYQTFIKQGGWTLIRNYWRAGVLLTAVRHLLLYGFSRRSLEMLRYGVDLKVNRKLRKRYLPLLTEQDATVTPSASISEGKLPVWFCWMQGLEQAPELVKVCFQSLKRHITDRPIILLTADNLTEYVTMPDYIMDKYHRKLITPTHFSDLLRMELLVTHGGTWIDATVYCSSDHIPTYMLDSPLFLFQRLKPGADGCTCSTSSWFITARPGNPILRAVRKMLWAYWQQNDYLVDYYLLHHFMDIAASHYPNEWKQIVQFSNSVPHILLMEAFEPYDKQKWEAVMAMTPFHKLTYKRTPEELSRPNTFYRHILDNED